MGIVHFQWSGPPEPLQTALRPLRWPEGPGRSVRSLWTTQDSVPSGRVQNSNPCGLSSRTCRSHQPRQLATERLFVVQSFMVATVGRAERERERLRKLEVKRKEQRWLNPSAAQLQREHEYMDWVLTRPEQFSDEPRNDTFEIFLAERSFAREKERLRLVAERRKHERQEKRRLADAAKPARPAAVRRAAQPKTETARPSASEAVPRPPQPRGRPVDPNSKLAAAPAG